jgi:hypothetical protein
VRSGSVLRITGEQLTVEGITPLTVPQVQPGRGEAYPQPALRISERGLASTAVPHYAGESIIFMPDRPAVVPGLGVEHVEVDGDTAQARLVIRTGPEPQKGLLAQVHFGEAQPMHGAPMVALRPQAAEDGDSLTAYGLAPGALSGLGFGIYCATPPRPSTSYGLGYSVIGQGSTS